jgi:hypothetical protein
MTNTRYSSYMICNLIQHDHDDYCYNFIKKQVSVSIRQTVDQVIGPALNNLSYRVYDQVRQDIKDIINDYY